MRKVNSKNPLLPKAVRKLAPIPAKGPAPQASIALASITVSGRAAPRIITEVRAIGEGRSAAWQVTVSTTDIAALSKPTPFIVRKVRRARYSKASASEVIVTSSHRPPWIAFAPSPRKLRLGIGPKLTLSGKPVQALGVVPPFDNRRVYSDFSYPWGCVCKIQSGKLSGSGVLIGPRHVLTASHVVDWNAGWATVEVQTFDKKFASGSCVASFHAFTQIGNVSPTTVDEDYAVLTLFDRLGDQFGWIGCRTYDAGWDDKPFWRTMGYPSEIGSGRRPTFEEDFHLDEDEFDLGTGRSMTCGADLTKGQSGSPIFGFWGETPRVVAVVSAQEVSGDSNYCAGGSDLPRLIAEVRNAVP